MKKTVLLMLIVMLTVLCCTTALAATTPGPVSEATIQAKLGELIRVAEDGFYFTKDGDPCNATYISGHGNNGCANCNVTAVVQPDSYFRKNSGLSLWPTETLRYHKFSTALYKNGYSCAGFSAYAGWYLAAHKNTDRVLFQRVITCHSSEANKFAQPGDMIRSSGHSLIYVAPKGNNFTVIDCNSNLQKKGNCLIDYYERTVHGYVTISRASNRIVSSPYVKLNEVTLNGHTYVLYNGYGSWNNAKNFAESLGDGWHLATISSAEEQEKITDLVHSWYNVEDNSGNAWIGAQYINNSWQWITNEPFTYSNFRTNTAEEASPAYAYIAGMDFSHNGISGYYPAFTTSQGKWNSANELPMLLQSGFVAEYDPDLVNPQPKHLTNIRTIYTTSDTEVEVFTSADPTAEVFCCLNPHTQIITTAQYKGMDGKLWLQHEYGFIPMDQLTYVEDACETTFDDYSVPQGLMTHDPDFYFDIVIDSTDSMTGFEAVIIDRATDKVVQTASYYVPDALPTAFNTYQCGINDTLNICLLPAGSYRFQLTPQYGIRELNGTISEFERGSFTCDFTMDDDRTAIEYEVVYSSGLHMRSSADKSSASVTIMPYQSHFFVLKGTETVNETDGYTWAYCFINDGTNQHGWVAISNSNYCVPVESEEEITRSDIVEYEVVYSGGLKILGEANNGSTCIQVMPKGTHFWVWTDENKSAGNYIWGHAYLEDGTEGWVAISNASYCLPVQGLPWGDMIVLSFSDDRLSSFESGCTAIATCMDSNLTDISWISSDEEVLALSPFGEDNEFCTITAISEGTATITVGGKYSQTFYVVTPEEFTVGDFTLMSNVITETPNDYLITGYHGDDSYAFFPGQLENYTITAIASTGLFDDTSIETLVIDEGIENIYANAFAYGMLRVKDVFLPSTMSRIYTDAFVFDADMFVNFHFASPDTYLDRDAVINARWEDEQYGEAYKITFHCDKGSFAEAYANERSWDVVYPEGTEEDTYETVYDNGSGTFYFANQINPVSYAPNSYLAQRMASILANYPVGTWFTSDGKEYDGTNAHMTNPITNTQYANDQLWDLRFAYVIYHALFNDNLNDTGTGLLTDYTAFDATGTPTAQKLHQFFQTYHVQYGTHFRNNSNLSLIVLDYDAGGVTAINCGSSKATHGERRIGTVRFTWQQLAALLNTSKIYIEQPNTQLSLSAPVTEMNMGQMVELTVAMSSYNDRDAIRGWSTSNENIATVENGRVTASTIFGGEVTITVHTNFGFSASCTLHVDEPKVFIAEDTIVLLFNPWYVMHQRSVYGYTVPEEADPTAAQWYSSNENVVTVKDGLLTANGPGTATVGLLHPSMEQDTCTVVVIQPSAVLEIPAGTTVIEDEAFSGVPAELILLPDSVTCLGSRVFAGCTQDLYVHIPATVTQLSADALDGADHLFVITPFMSPAMQLCEELDIPYHSYFEN